MSAPPRVYTIITESGRTKVEHEKDYWSILSDVHLQYMSAGGSWDRPNMLLLNGKVVVPEGLAGLAWRYGNELRDAVAETTRDIREKHMPEWMK